MANTHLIDPKGRRLTLHDVTWDDHVLKRHADMKPYRRAAEATVRRPEAIHRSASHAGRRIYYSRPDPRGIMFAVVGDLTKRMVVTAYRTRRKIGAVE